LTSQWRRLDFSQSSLDDLGLSAERSVFYDDSGGPDLATILKRTSIPPGSIALDYGSGKGGALITLARFPFDQVIGVEISPALIDVAVENLRRARVEKARVINCDAAAFQELDRVTHIYMYHPFRGEVIDAVLSNVQASLARAARRLTLIYKNPVYHDAITHSGIFRLQRELHVGRPESPWGLYHLYVHDPNAVFSGLSAGPSM
jgi:SAM-dependent methyltransferase